MQAIIIKLLKKALILFIGFFMLSLGIVICIKAQIGVSPWDVFNQGLVKVTGLAYGQVNILVGLGILSIAMLIKVYPGIGTILNILFVSIFIDMIMPFIPVAPNFTIGLAMNIIGSISMAFGSCFYLLSKTGAGPRDSLLVGLMQKFNLDTKYVKPLIEGTVLIIGVILKGNFGIGTFVSVIVMSNMMDVFFKLLKFNPKKEKQDNIKIQVGLIKGVLVNEGSNS